MLLCDQSLLNVYLHTYIDCYNNLHHNPSLICGTYIIYSSIWLTFVPVLHVVLSLHVRIKYVPAELTRRENGVSS